MALSISGNAQYLALKRSFGGQAQSRHFEGVCKFWVPPFKDHTKLDHTLTNPTGAQSTPACPAPTA